MTSYGCPPAHGTAAAAGRAAVEKGYLLLSIGRCLEPHAA